MGTAGLDEAGRGPVIGPMVVAGVVLSRKAARELKSLGVKDSKLLTPERREGLAPLIRDMADAYAIRVVEPRRIDDVVSHNGLNLLEAEVMADIIKELSPSLVIVDAPGRNTRKFREILKSHLGEMKVKIRAENKADRKFVHVAAASILAKVERDRRIAELREIAGLDFGSGYPSDPKTREFLLKVLDGLSFPKEQVRWRWATLQNLLEEKRRVKITDFLD